MLRLILIFLFSTQAIASDLQHEFDKRIKLYGLDQKKELELIEQNHIGIKTSKKQVIQKLNRYIEEEYIPYLNDFFTCQGENCLEIDGDVRKMKYKEKTVCLPYTECGFYKCMEEEYQCMDAGFEYFKNLAYPTCSTYKSNMDKNYFSEQGVEWIYEVMVCLQKGLTEECDINGNCKKETNAKSCNYITEYTLNFHPGCYINSGVGVCKLPLKDKINIWRTVGKFLTDREREEAMKVVWHCVKTGF